MAVAAYASLVSLTHVLDNLHYRARFDVPRADIKQVEALKKNVNSLLEFVELHSGRKCPELRGLWRQMAEAATEAEGAMNFHVSNLLYANSQGESDTLNFSDFFEEMETLIQKFASIEKEFPMIEEEGEDAQAQTQPNASVTAGGSSAAAAYVSSVVVGLDEHVNILRDKLIRGKSNLEILSIVGMGGIGKTTLAKSLFDDLCVIDHFDLRIWLSISQHYSAEQILKVGLEEKAGENETCESLDELGIRFYQKLFGRRYLVVMDDMWSTGAWHDLRRYFPNTGDGSRILLTTRLSNMAASLASHDPYLLTFLNENQSWSLFCQSAFSQKDCPFGHLEKLAKEIAKCCRGLPLEIVVVGRLLANSERRVKYWEYVLDHISSFANLGDDEHCRKILSLSYESLPIHLQPCFLYLRVFPEDSSIAVSEVVDFWIAEGFIKSMSFRSLEDIAREYVESLIDRNLIFDRGESQCGIHDLLRDLCLRESKDECFLQLPRSQSVKKRFIKVVHCNLCLDILINKEGMHIGRSSYTFGLSSQVNSFVCDACMKMYLHIKRLNLVKISEYDDCFDTEILHPIEVHRVYLEEVKLFIPSTLKLLWNLQSLRIYLSPSLKELPQDIWEMPQLREIEVSGGILPDPIATDIEGENFLVLNDLHTIDGIYNFKCTKAIIDRIPSLRKLNVSYEDGSKGGVKPSNFSLCNLDKLEKLESLMIRNYSENMTFPNSLKELSLYNCRMAWEDMSIVGSLPSLEHLHIYGDVEGSEWEPVQGEFLSLKELLIGKNDLVCWRAESVHFPILESLQLTELRLLEEIPMGIGDVPTLQSIIVDYCRESVIDSAKEIWKEQLECENGTRIDVIDRELSVRYQVGTYTARMTGAGCQTFAYSKYLWESLDKVVRHGSHTLNTKHMEAVEEAIHFFKVFHPRKSQEMESLLREMALATHKANVVIDRLRSKTLMPILGKCIRVDVERLLEIIVFIRKALALAVAKEEGKEGEEIDVSDDDATSYDINSLTILKEMFVTDEDLREYQIGSVTATMSEAASLVWSDLACVLGVLRKAYELGCHHLNTEQVDNVKDFIHLLQEVVEVYPQSIHHITKPLFRLAIIDLFKAAEQLNSKHLWQQSLVDATVEDLLSFSRDVENLLRKSKYIKRRLIRPQSEDSSQGNT
ncbi:late blight resistance protein R1-A-like [Andrographis paniculata]|uniref:late blight resistance protein R1-A-like n=1 Tax=Andrographis paniculata TaxID=175694 RepID=UPI0021E76F3D|nr:late blight resistance protein R1-A-like [Andrographis paniculata]